MWLHIFKRIGIQMLWSLATHWWKNVSTFSNEPNYSNNLFKNVSLAIHLLKMWLHFHKLKRIQFKQFVHYHKRREWQNITRMCRIQRGDSNSSYQLREGGSRRICSVWIGSEVKSYEQNKGNTDTHREISSTYIYDDSRGKKNWVQIITHEYITWMYIHTWLHMHQNVSAYMKYTHR